MGLGWDPRSFKFKGRPMFFTVAFPRRRQDSQKDSRLILTVEYTICMFMKLPMLATTRFLVFAKTCFRWLKSKLARGFVVVVVVCFCFRLFFFECSVCTLVTLVTPINPL